LTGDGKLRVETPRGRVYININGAPRWPERDVVHQ